MIELHSTPTPNGQKVMIMLEETGLEWRHIDTDISLGAQFSPEHLKLSPNNKIPAIVDFEGPDGKPYAMMESGAILIYLAEKTGKLLPKEARRHYDTLQWLMFQVAHVGPMFGQAHHFNSYSQENVSYAKDRYNNESTRLYRVLDNRLRESPWIGCDTYTIADIAVYPWTKGHRGRGVEETYFPHFLRWFRTMEERPAVQRNNELTEEIRARMRQAAAGKRQIDLYNTQDNADRLVRATER